MTTSPSHGRSRAATAALASTDAPVLTQRPAIAADTVATLLHALPFLYMVGYFWPPMNHDVGALVETSRRWLDGDRLYIDLIDVNTPLTFALHTLPTLFSRLTGIPVATATIILFVSVVLAAGIACRRFILAGPLGKGRLSRDALPFISAFALAMSTGHEFGQREHLMLCGALVYALLAGMRAEGKVSPRTSAIVGLLAGIGFAMKPYFLVIPLFIEAYLLLRRPLKTTFLDPGPWMIAAAVAAHAILIIFITPAYITNVLPLAFSEYLAVGGGALTVLREPAMGATTVVLAGLFAVILLGRRAPAHIILALLALGAVIICVVQGKGWSYHTIPAIASTLFLLVTLAADQVDRRFTAIGGQRVGTLAIGAALLAIVVYPYFLSNAPFAYQQRYQRSVAKQLGDLMAVEAPNHRIFAFSPGIYPFFPTIVYEKTTLDGRYLTMWPIQGLYASCLSSGRLYRPLDQMPDLEKRVFEEIVTDFIASKADMIFEDNVPGIPQCGPDVFSYIDYFSRDPRFVKALSAYEIAYDFDRYTIWRRRKD